MAVVLLTYLLTCGPRSL